MTEITEQDVDWVDSARTAGTSTFDIEQAAGRSAQAAELRPVNGNYPQGYQGGYQGGYIAGGPGADDLLLPSDLTPAAPGSIFRRQQRDTRAIGGSGFAPKPQAARRAIGAAKRVPHYIDAQLGSIHFDLARIMVERGIVSDTWQHEGYPNVSALTRGTGISQGTTFRLLRHPDQVSAMSLDTLARLCEFLHCQPGDILRYHALQRTTRRTPFAD